MIHNPNAYRTLPVGVVLRRSPGVTRWAAHYWAATSLLPGAGPADWRQIRRDGDTVEFHAATPVLELHGAETEAYLHALQTNPPSLYVILRPEGEGLEVLGVTASPYEAQDYGDTGEEIVERVEMPEGLVGWIWDFVEAHHTDEVFVKRRRDRKRVDLSEAGIGDARIAQTADVYRSPVTARKERLQ